MQLTTEILGWIGFTTSLSMLLPQLYKVLKTKTTKSLSLLMFVIAFINAIAWFAYGVIENKPQIYGSNAVGLVASAIILGFIIYNKIYDDAPVKEKLIETKKQFKEKKDSIYNEISQIKTQYLSKIAEAKVKEERESLLKELKQIELSKSKELTSFYKNLHKQYKTFKYEYELSHYPKMRRKNKSLDK